VTLCAAAICDWGESGDSARIVAICDRMITMESPDSSSSAQQFEQPQTKMWQFNESVLFFVSGDIDTQTEIFNGTLNAIRPDAKVAQIADVYADQYRSVYQRRIERAILAAYPLDLESYIAKQSQLKSKFVMEIKKEIDDYPRPKSDVLIAGIERKAGADRTCPQIYGVYNGQVYNHENTGFSVVGSGSDFAELHLILAGHAKRARFVDTLIAVYFAKRSAEVNPYVGRETDMFVIGPGVGKMKRINDPVRPERDFLGRVLRPLYDRQAEEKKIRLTQASQSVCDAWNVWHQSHWLK
jgi:hypothetical protein